MDNVNLLPLFEGMRILEIGCGPGTAAREIANRFHNIHILAIDRSDKAIELAKKSSQKEISAGKLSFQQIAIEDFEIKDGDEKFDLVFAIRVGALDGRQLPSRMSGIELSTICRLLKLESSDGKRYWSTVIYD